MSTITCKQGLSDHAGTVLKGRVMTAPSHSILTRGESIVTSVISILRTGLPFFPGDGGFSPWGEETRPSPQRLLATAFGSTRQPHTARWAPASPLTRNISGTTPHSSSCKPGSAVDHPRPPQTALHYLPHYSIQGGAPVFPHCSHGAVLRAATGCRSHWPARGFPGRLRVGDGGGGEAASSPSFP